jgi:arylformamidase
MQPRWQDILPENLEGIYNPRAANKNLQAALEQRTTLSEQARADLANTSIATEDIRYGTAPNQLLDLYQPKALSDKTAPLVVFIHGGYWRAGDKRESTHVVPALIGAGAVVANINYDLCPKLRWTKWPARRYKLFGTAISTHQPGKPIRIT